MKLPKLSKKQQIGLGFGIGLVISLAFGLKDWKKHQEEEDKMIKETTAKNWSSVQSDLTKQWLEEFEKAEEEEQRRHEARMRAIEEEGNRVIEESHKKHLEEMERLDKIRKMIEHRHEDAVKIFGES